MGILYLIQDEKLLYFALAITFFDTLETDWGERLAIVMNNLAEIV
jgi:hypothetical protein